MAGKPVLPARLPHMFARPDVRAEGILSAHPVRDGSLRWWRHFLAKKVPASAALLLLLMGLVALLAPYLTPHNPSQVVLSQTLLAPGPGHPLGTDALGRDILSRAMHGARVSLAVGTAAAGLAALLGLTLGLAAAFRGGWIDAIITRLVDAFLAVPAFFLLIAIQSILGAGVLNVVLLASMLGWMMVARVVRGMALSLKEREFIAAARALGCSETRIIAHHIVPNLAGPAVILFALGVADALLLESALSFLGLGIPPTDASWGNMLSEAPTAILSGAWWIPTIPGVLILATCLAINLVGDGLQEALGRFE